MKLVTLTITTLAILDTTGAESWLRKVTPKVLRGDSLEEDTDWLDRLLQAVSSLDTANPTPDTSSDPTPNPTLDPTPFPTPIVTSLTAPPTQASTPGSSLVPTPASTPGQTPVPTVASTVASTPDFTNATTLTPTGPCAAQVFLDCTSFEGDIPLPCEEIPPIDMPFCMCEECVREVRFMYTGKPCDGLEGCVDGSLEGPGENATISFSACGSDVSAFEDTVGPASIVVLSLGDECLPECMDVSVVSTSDPTSNQTFTLDTSCITRELLLKESYGAVDFVGYSCNSTTSSNCFQEITYFVDACNDGFENLTVYDLSVDFNGETASILDEDDQPVVLPGECFNSRFGGVVDRCQEMPYSLNVSMNATVPVDGPICENTDEHAFLMIAGTIEDTPSPSAAELTPSPSVTTTELPPPPTDGCNLNVAVELECPVLECGWDRCRERPYRMEFRFNPNSCADSILKRCPGVDPDTCSCVRNVTIGEEDWAEQQFSCADFGAGPVNGSDTYYVMAYPEMDPSLPYFEGEMVPGGRFNAPDPNMERVEANMFLDLYAFSNGTQGELLQQVLFHSSCSQELYLLDIFGSFQLVEFESLLALTTYAISPISSFALTMNAASDFLELDFIGLAVFSPDPDLLPPQTEIFNVSGTVIPPPFAESTTVELIPNEDFTIVTTVTGALNGVACMDITELVVNCPASVEPNSAR